METVINIENIQKMSVYSSYLIALKFIKNQNMLRGYFY